MSNQICRGESSDSGHMKLVFSALSLWNGIYGRSKLRFEDKAFNGQIDFTGPVIDQKSGGMTGTDTMEVFGTEHCI